MKETLNKIKKGSTVIIALSGGPDSVYLLHLVKKLEKKLDLTIITGHLNHGIRRNSGRDEKFCRKLCKKLEVIFETEKVSLRGVSNLEEKARNLRYEFFENLKKKYNAKYILTGHHLNDSIETVFLNLTRGCSLSGLTGISDQKYVLRPLKNITKDDILKYLKKHKIKCVIDSTNKQNKYSLNKIRNLVITVLKKINPSLEKTFKKNMENFEKIHRFLEDEARKFLGKKLEFDVKKFKAKNDVIQSAILELIYREKTDGTIGLNSKQIEMAKTIILKNKNLEGHLGSISFKTEYGICHFEEKKEVKTSSFTVEKIKCPSSLKSKTHTIYVTSDIDPALVTLRNWQAGDKFQPLGMKRGTKKLQDFFTDRKIPENIRHSIPIITYKKDIVAIGNLEISEKFKVKEKSTSAFQITLASKKAKS